MRVYLGTPHTYDMKVYLAGAAAGNNAKIWREGTADTNKVMRVFLAGLHADKNRAGSAGDFGQRIAVLESFYYIKDWMLPYIKDHWHFMLDSGAFTFMQDKSVTVDWVEYVERYAEFINRNNIDLFLELDLDAVIGLERTEELRTRLERLTNKQPITVWHHSRGRKYWERMCDEYKYVALGGMVSDRNYRKRLEPMFPYFIDHARRKKVKIHALGYTSIDGLFKYKFDSVDSTAWIYGNRSGMLYKFNGRTIDKINGPTNTRMKSTEAAVHNFREWVKFQQYAEQHL